MQHENFGLLDYKPNSDAIPFMGFHPEEILSDGSKFNVMSGKNALLVVRNKEKIILPYFLPYVEPENLLLTIKAEGVGSATMPVEKSGLIELNFPPADEPWEVELELSKTFVDKQGRTFGLAIIFESTGRS